MSEHDQTNGALIERDLGAIDDALASGLAADGDPAARELQELALMLAADAPEPDSEFARTLHARMETGFPPSPASARGRMESAGARLSGAGASLRHRLAGAPATARHALPAVGVILTILVPLVVVVSLVGPPSPGGSDDDSGGSGGGAVALQEGAESSGGGGAVEPAPAAPDQAVRGGSGVASPLPLPPDAGFVPGRRDRRIERSVALELGMPVDEMARVAEQVTTVTNRYGGFVLSSSVSTGQDGAGGDFQLRIPSNQLRPAVRDLAALATVRSQNQSGRDVTRDFVTSRDRLRSARAERRSLLRRLEQAETDEQAEAIRRRLDLVAGEINGLRAQLRDLRLRTDYAVVTVSLLADEEGSSGEGGAGGSFDDALGDAGDLLVGSAGVMIRILALALPIGLIAALGWLVSAALRRRRRESALA